MFNNNNLRKLKSRNVTSFSDFYLVPKKSEVSTRDACDITCEFLGSLYANNVVPANMQSVVSPSIVNSLYRACYFYIYHRFDGSYTSISSDLKFLSLSVGTNTKAENIYLYENLFETLKSNNKTLSVITIDIAHGHSKNAFTSANYISGLIEDTFPECKLIIGNVTTKEAIQDIYNYTCSDAVKIGIGGGSICSTKNTTGFHVPMVNAIVDCCSEIRKINDDAFDIIIDGGIREDGDIVKATWLALQCNPDKIPMIMCGGLFAPCIDAPGISVYDDNNNITHKTYWGSASSRQKGNNRHVEGFDKTVPCNGLTVLEKMEEINDHMKSAVSYSGGRCLYSLSDVDCVVVK